jgi:hypothetical protein
MRPFKFLNKNEREKDLTNPFEQMEFHEGWLATSYWGDQNPTQPAICPYNVGTRAYELWMMGYTEYLSNFNT